MLAYSGLIRIAIAFGLINFTPIHDLSFPPKTTVKKAAGSFTGKHKRETVYMIPPKISASGFDCDGPCVVELKFSDPTIPEIKIKSCIGGTPVNLGDLDNDGTDEIGILRDWFTSCWRDYEVYTFKKGKWEMAVPPIRTHCNQWDEKRNPIVKDPNRKGYVKITYSDFVNNEVVVKTKSIPVI